MQHLIRALIVLSFTSTLTLAGSAGNFLHARDAQGATIQANQGVANASAIRIITPRAGEKIQQSFVTVRYEMIAPATAESTPTFQVRMDGSDSAQTPFTERTYNGLTPGPHNFSVELVDANGTPINGTRAEVEFHIVPAATKRDGSILPQPINTRERRESLAAGDGGSGGLPTSLVPAVLAARPGEGAQDSAGERQESQESSPRNHQLPVTGSPLPILALIGFGIVVGGVVSARRTRSR